MLGKLRAARGALAVLGLFVFSPIQSAVQAADDIGVVAMEGDRAPGLPAGSVFSSIGGFGNMPVVNNNGRVAFIASARTPLDGLVEGVWVGYPGDIRLVARVGGEAPGTSDGSLFADFSEIVLSDNGEVAFAARLTGPFVTVGNRNGLWAGQIGKLKMVARTGQTAPETVAEYSAFDRFAFNNGTIAFVARLTTIVDGLGNLGAWAGKPGGLSLLVRQGGQAPDSIAGDTINMSTADQLFVTTEGEVVFRSLVNPIVVGPNIRVVYQGKPGDLRIISANDDLVPGLGAGARIASTQNWTHTNAFGQVGLDQGLFRGGDITFDNDWILRAGDPDDLKVVAREGDPVPGSGGSLIYAQRSAILGTAPVLSRNGDVAFRTGVLGNSDTVIVAGPIDDPLLVRRGSLGDPAINARGHIAFLEQAGPAVWRLWAGPADRTKVVAETGSEIEMDDGAIFTINRSISFDRVAGDSEGLPRMYANNGQAVFMSQLLNDLGRVAGNAILVAPAQRPGVNDADVVWYDQKNGEVALERVRQLKSRKPVKLPKRKDVRWSVLGRGDFNNSAQADVIWHNAKTNQTEVWLMRNGKFRKSVKLPARNARLWSFKGTGDFNGNDTDDVLWQHQGNGSVEIWRIKNGKVAETIRLGRQSNPDWVIAAIGDFNGDLTDDILWHNVIDGRVQIWHIQKHGLIEEIDLPKNTNLKMAVTGAGDFDGDNTEDILWQDRANGKQELWRLIDFTQADVKKVKRNNTQWKNALVTDLDNDGLADIYWRSRKNGNNVIWKMIAHQRDRTAKTPRRPFSRWTAH